MNSVLYCVWANETMVRGAFEASKYKIFFKRKLATDCLPDGLSSEAVFVHIWRQILRRSHLERRIARRRRTCCCICLLNVAVFEPHQVRFFNFYNANFEQLTSPLRHQVWNRPKWGLNWTFMGEICLKALITEDILTGPNDCLHVWPMSYAGMKSGWRMLMIKSFAGSSHRNAFQTYLSTLTAELRQKKMKAIENTAYITQ